MTSSRQVAHIQMFSQFPLCVYGYLCVCVHVLLDTPRAGDLSALPNNITTGAVYTIMTCIARGPATSVVPFLHLCLSLVPSLCLSFSVSLSLYLPNTKTCPHFSCSSFILTWVFSPCLIHHKLPTSFCPQVSAFCFGSQHYYKKKKLHGSLCNDLMHV